jgi:predicted nucleotidyltransferase
MSADEKQLEQVLALVRGVLGPDVVGAYLHGSAVLGGMRPRSDVDVLVVSRRRTTRGQKRRLVEGLFAVSGRNPPATPRPVELTIVVEPEIRPWRYPPRMDFQYGEWLRREFESGELEPWETTNPDLASLIAIVLLGDRALLGPAPAEVLDPIPREDYTRAMVAGVDGLLRDLEPDTANVVLTLARIWSTIATGTITSKDAAADWVLERLPDEQRPVLVRARAVYLGEADDTWDDLEQHVRPHADYVVREIERLASDPTSAPLG